MGLQIKNEKELVKLGAIIDPNNPTQAIPIADIFRNGKYEEMSIDVLINHANRIFDSILSNERCLVTLYWQLGDILRVIRQQHKHGSWMDFVKEQGWSYKRVWQAINIRNNIVKPEALDDLTVEEALHNGRESFTDLPENVYDQPIAKKKPAPVHNVGIQSISKTNKTPGQPGDTEAGETDMPSLNEYLVEFVLHCSMSVEAVDEMSAQAQIEEDEDLIGGMDISHVDGIEVLNVMPFDEYLEKVKKEERKRTQ